MPLRPASGDDVRPLAELWLRAFPGEHNVGDRQSALEAGRPYGGVETAWVWEERGRIAAAIRGYRMTQYIDGVPLPMMGVASVAVASTARRRGLGRRICAEALRLGRERGDVVSALYPFRADFYRALGYGLVGRLDSAVFRTDALPAYDELSAVRDAGGEDRDRITDCYARVAARSHGPIERAAAAWEHHLSPDRLHPVLYDDGGVRGYLLALYGDGNGLLTVRELVAEDDAAYRGLLGWVSAQRDQWAAARYDARPDERFDLRLSDPRRPRSGPARRLWFHTARRIRGPMLRVLDAAAALEAKPRWGRGDGAALTLEIEIEDRELPENRGPWTVAVEEDGARVHERRSGGADARLATDAATFAQIYAGELLPSEALRLGLAELDGAVDALDRAFRIGRSFWLMDEF